MSWDIFAQDLPASIMSQSDIPDDFVPQPLGQRVSLIAKILGVVPQADFADPGWGKIRTPDCEIEIGMGNDEDVQSIVFHVYAIKNYVPSIQCPVEYKEFWPGAERVLSGSTGE